MTLRLSTGVGELPGVGPARKRSLEKLGLRTVGDLLSYYPRSYEDRRRTVKLCQAPEGIPVCIRAIVAQPPRLSRIRKGLTLTKVRIADDTGAATVTFFNQDYIRDALRTGEDYVFYGAVEGSAGSRSMTNPAFERAECSRFTGRILPVYPLTKGVSNNLLAGLTLRCVEACADETPESLPPEVLRDNGLCGAACACRSVHFPESETALEQARRRLIFEELFTLTCGLALLRTRREQAAGAAFRRAPLAEFEALLPFPLTGAQRRVMEEVAADTASGAPMNRLVQGDVGSGKTMVAAFGAWLAARSGFQCALMAPTELLAEQHFRSLEPLLAPAGMKIYPPHCAGWGQRFPETFRGLPPALRIRAGHARPLRGDRPAHGRLQQLHFSIFSHSYTKYVALH